MRTVLDRWSHVLKPIGFLLLIGLFIVGGLQSSTYGQTFNAQIQQFWNQLRTGALVFSHLRTVDATCTGTCTGFGGGGGGGSVSGVCPAGQVFIATSDTVPPTCVNVIDSATLTANAPFTIQQEWNNAAVNFTGLHVGITETAQAIPSAAFDVVGGAAGTSQLFCVGEFCNSTYVVSVTNNELKTADLLINGTASQTAGRFFCTNGAGGCFRYKSVGNFSVDNNAGVDTVAFNVNAATINDFGTGATLSGNASVGRVTVGTAPGATGVIDFTVAWDTNAPHCDAIDETTGVAIPVVATTSAATFTGVFTASDLISYRCTGWHPQ